VDIGGLSTISSSMTIFSLFFLSPRREESDEFPGAAAPVEQFPNDYTLVEQFPDVTAPVEQFPDTAALVE